LRGENPALFGSSPGAAARATDCRRRPWVLVEKQRHGGMEEKVRRRRRLFATCLPAGLTFSDAPPPLFAMPLLTIVPPMPGAERRFKPFVDFVHACGWETEFVRLAWPGHRPPFGSTEIFPQVDAQTAGKVVMGYSLGALYAHLGALHARHLILGSISPFFLEDDDEPDRWMISYRGGNAATPADVLVGALEDEQMHRRATAIRDFYLHRTYTVVPAAEHELWHPNYLQAIKSALDRIGTV
jgi:hypothetical protein